MATPDVAINVGANITGLRASLTEAQRLVRQQAAVIDREFAVVRNSARGLGTVLGVGFAGFTLAAFTRQTISGLDALDDLKDATGASIENLSGLEDIALRTGTSFETAGAALIKFNKELSDAKPGTETAQIFKALGLSAEELKKIDPAEALTKTAVALAQFADDGNKARIVQALFGKSVGDVAPLLQDLAEQGKLAGTATTEQVEAAKAFNKQLLGMQKNVTDAARALAGDLLPKLTALTSSTDSTVVGFDLLGLATGGVKNAFEAVAVLGANLEFVLSGLGRELGAIAAQSVALATLDFKGFSAISEAVKADAVIARAELDALEKKLLGLPRVAKSPVARLDPPRPSAPDVSSLKDTTAKQTDAQKYLENLQKQLQATQSLSVAQTVLADIESQRLKLAAGESSAPLLAIARQLDAAKAAADVAEKVKQRIDALPSSKVAELNEQLQALLASRPAAGPGSTDEAIQALREELEKYNPESQLAAANTERLIALLAATKTSGIAALNADLDLLRANLADTGNVAQYVEAVLARVGIPDEAIKSIDEFTVFAEQAARNIQDSLGSGVKDFLNGEYKSISGLFKNLIVDLTSQAISAQLGKVLLGDFAKTGNVGGGLGKLFDFGASLFNANGNAFDQRGRITAFAAGGVFNGPTPFQYGGGQLGVLGEAGPEAIMPLRRGPGGQLGVVAQGGSGSSTVINNISVGAGVTRGEVVALLQAYGNNLKAEILASQRNGGAFSR